MNRRRVQGSEWKPIRGIVGGLEKNCRCGERVIDGGKLCQECRTRFQEDSEWLSAGRRQLAIMRLQGFDPAHGGEAGEKRSMKVSHENRISQEWNRANRNRPDPEVFEQEILPGLRDVPLSEMADASGLSIDYCSKIRRGVKTPHPRHWEALRQTAKPKTPA